MRGDTPSDGPSSGDGPGRDRAARESPARGGPGGGRVSVPWEQDLSAEAAGRGGSLDRLVGVFRLTRVTTAFAAVANVWFVILWTRANGLEPSSEALRTGPLWFLLLGGGVFAVGLYAFAACLNDVLDVSRDRALHVNRPMPSGQVGPELAATATAGTLIAALVGATVFGTPAVLAALLLAGAVLGFHAVGKHIPGVGLVLLAGIYAGHMLVPNMSWWAGFGTCWADGRPR